MRYAILGGFALFLCACDNTPFSGASSDADAAIDGDVKQQAGLYRDRITIGGAQGDNPGGQYGEDEKCLTEEDVKDGHRAMLLAAQGGDVCSFTKYDLDGETLDAVMVCKPDASQPETRANIEGTITSTGSDLTMTVAGFGEGNGAVSMRVESERIGDCD